ncbi:Bcr/CflA family drug resistance efflux transporter [Malaciobacter canalis]|uniref:DHA1 family bicyclomycin/chloramphenicol resistance-like MFS transporter n=2 Tax=Malaciobacter TaxID=2321114 RepID=A0AB36ZYR7_9BACT|nr:MULTISPECIES: multidrug effflux MFS transporter [Malaciobacter]PHO09286.1 Bcr/CflA family drug resistance efflux transporter [Malaciobacter canalis]PPK62647.1 DHA1 family bicyclomycin/chloramphenicol resistance-like MFS transporter [Malaciobacter marinus]QEE34193.1 drug resistance transporter, Bcr/CflA family [Malaciobacter canalis]
MRKSIGHIYLIILLAVLSSVAPIAIDTYIPSIPTIATDFNVSIEKIELTLSIFLIGFSIGQIFGGTFSDRIGRRKSSIIGLIGFSFFSFLIILSSSVYELWIFRFFEAFFGGFVVVNANAVVRDLFHGKEAAKIFSLIGTVRSIAPLAAPAIGSFIIHFYSWKAVFVFLCVYSLLVALWVYKDLNETFTYTNQKVIESYKAVLKNKMAMKAMLTLAICFSGFFILVAKSSFIYIEYFNISTDYFPFFFGINFLVLMAMIRVNVMLLKYFTQLELIKYTIIIQIVAGILLMTLAQGISIITTVILIATYMSMMAFIFGNSTALAMEHFSKNAGVASSVIGVLQFGLGALISSIALMFHTQTFMPIGASIATISLVAYLIIRTYKFK